MATNNHEAAMDPTDVICGLKAAVTALECYHEMNLLKQQQEEALKERERKLSPPPMYMMIPIVKEKSSRAAAPAAAAAAAKKKIRRSDKSSLSRGGGGGGGGGGSSDEIHEKCVNFPEMRSGILFGRCFCVHRDGLQDSCPLSQCQGREECLVKPWPVCPPAKFLRSRHPELYPSK